MLEALDGVEAGYEQITLLAIHEAYCIADKPAEFESVAIKMAL